MSRHRCRRASIAATIAIVTNACVIGCVGDESTVDGGGGSTVDGGNGNSDSSSTAVDAGAAVDSNVADSNANVADAADDAGDADATVEPPKCDVDKPFTTMEPLFNIEAGYGGVTLSKDGLTLYMYGPNGPATATRSSLGAAFGAPAALFNGLVGTDNSTSVTGDELTLYFTHFIGGTDYQIMTATRANKTLPFSAPIPAGVTGPSTRVASSYVREDGQRIYFHSIGGGRDIFVATRPTPTSPFGPAAPVGTPINTANDEWLVVISPDDLVMYYGSNLEGTDASKLRIFVSKRTTPNAIWGIPRVVTELDGPAGVGRSPMWISRDYCTLYYAGGGLLKATRAP